MKTIIMLTGERDWTDVETIYLVLDDELRAHMTMWLDQHGLRLNDEPGLKPEARQEMLEAFVLRHGANNSGADAIANRWGIERKVTVERFKAEWTNPMGGGVDYSAGPRRNEKMVQAKPEAEVCLAFWSGNWRTNARRPGTKFSGTCDALSVALRHGIPVRAYPPKKKVSP